MKLSCKSALVAAVVGLGLMSSAANAQVVTTLFDSQGFETPAYAVGALDGQNGWLIDPAGAAGRFQVISLGGSGQAVGVAGGAVNSITTAWAFPDVTYTPAAGERVVIEADIARSVGATAATSSAGFYVDVYGGPAGGRTFRFGLGFNSTSLLPVVQVVSRFNTTTGQFDPTGGVFNVSITSGLAVNSFYKFTAIADYQAKNFSLNVGGTNLGTFPFADLTATSIWDADLNVSSNSGRTDSGFYDNYKVYTVVPEPTALGLLAPVGLMMARRRRA